MLLIFPSLPTVIPPPSAPLAFFLVAIAAMSAFPISLTISSLSVTAIVIVIFLFTLVTIPRSSSNLVDFKPPQKRRGGVLPVDYRIDENWLYLGIRQLTNRKQLLSCIPSHARRIGFQHTEQCTAIQCSVRIAVAIA